MIVFGTRPEAVKMAPVVLGFQKHPAEFDPCVVVTAQHRGLLDQVLRLFQIRPRHDLDIMRPGQTLTDISVRALKRLDPVIQKERPALILVHGDTSTALIAAQAAFYQKVPVGHVEAGLRSHDLQNPFPEEMNRRGIGVLATLHFSPTEQARRNLLREGVDKKAIFVTGNTGIDALRLGVARLAARSPRIPENAARVARGPFVLMTAHRRENFGKPLEQVFEAVRDVARARPHLGFVYPVHPNPNVLEPARRFLAGLPNVALTDPLDYGPMLYLMKRCVFALTDSGGIQEEAPGLGKPVLVLRNVTERPEAVRAGTARLVGTRRAAVREGIDTLLDNPSVYRRMARAVNPYGDGHAAARVVAAVRHWLDPRRPGPKPFVPSRRPR